MALYDYTTAIKIDSSNSILYYNRGSVLDSLKQYKEAIDNYTLAIEISPYNPQNYIARGMSKYNLELRIDACNDFTVAKSLDSTAVIYLNNFCK